MIWVSFAADVTLRQPRDKPETKGRPRAAPAGYYYYSTVNLWQTYDKPTGKPTGNPRETHGKTHGKTHGGTHGRTHGKTHEKTHGKPTGNLR